jgi:glucuronoarabinoxylan endo-1,4-beta-xylanase
VADWKSVRAYAFTVGLMLLATGQGASGQHVTVRIDPNTPHQTIDGFGVAQPRFGPWRPGDNTPADPARSVHDHPSRSQLMDMTFSALNGIGATILRMKITSALEPSLQRRHYETDVAQAWIMREAIARGPVKILATAWSPPPWMKTNGTTLLGRCSNNPIQVCGAADPDCGCDSDDDCAAGSTCLIGSLRLSHYQSFADYLVQFLRDYAAVYGVNIYALSMANEPDAQIEWDGCAWYGDWIATFLDLYLRPALSSYGIATKVVAPEAAVWNSVASSPPPDPFHTVASSCEPEPSPCPEWPNCPTPCTPRAHPLSPTTLMGPTMNNRRALGRVDIIAGHQYHGEPKDPLPAALISGKRVWMTEISGGATWTINGAIAQAKRIHDTLTGNARASAWMWFAYFGGPPCLPPSGCEDVDGALVGTDGPSVVPSKAFWALGNYSRFVRPDFVRIAATTSPSKVLASAYKEPVTGQLVIVVINEDTRTRDVRFTGLPASAVATPYVTSAALDLEPQPDVRIGAVPAAVPARSVVTYVTAPPRLTSDILWRKTEGNTLVWLGSIPATASYPGAVGNDWQIQGVGDFDGNGRGDILWRSFHGDNAIWSDAKPPGQRIAPVDNGWRVAGIGDFNGDGRSDILWRSVRGDNVIWPGGIAPGVWIVPVDNGWRVVGIGDFNSDGQSDILWRSVNGDNVIWPSGHAPGFWFVPLDGNWQVQGVGDFDGNRQSDILWRCVPQAPATACGDAVAGSVAIWHFANGNYGWTSWPGALDGNWQIHGAGDFDANGESDILWRCLPRAPATACGGAVAGSVAIWHFSSGSHGWTAWPGALDSSWQVQSIGRFDR